MERAEIDGVAVVWEQADGPLQAELAFACGHRDETLGTLGLTDLLQHLVDPDGATNHLSTSFYATGDVAEPIERICRDLSSLPLERLEKVATTLEPDLRGEILTFHSNHLYPAGSLLGRRFGAQGLGLSRWPAVDYDQFTADQLAAHAARYFTRGNAVLALTGPPPAGLLLPLPPGQRNVHEPSLRQNLGSVWYADDVAGVGMALTVGLDGPSELAWWLLFDRVQSAVQQARLGYLCTFEIRTFAAESRELVISLQREVTVMHPQPRRDDPAAAQRAAETMVGVLRRLALDGPAPEEMDGLRRHYSQAPTTRSTEQMAEQEMFGYAESMTPAQLAKLAEVQAHEVRSAVASWVRTAAVVVPRGVRPDLPGFAEQRCPASTRVPDGEVFKPSLLDRFRGRSSALEYAVLDHDGIYTVDDTETVHATPTADLMVLRQADRIWVGNLGHQCLTEVTRYGRAGDAIWQAAPAQRRRQAF